MTQQSITLRNNESINFLIAGPDGHGLIAEVYQVTEGQLGYVGDDPDALTTYTRKLEHEQIFPIIVLNADGEESETGTVQAFEGWGLQIRGNLSVACEDTQIIVEDDNNWLGEIDESELPDWLVGAKPAGMPTDAELWDLPTGEDLPNWDDLF